MNEPAQCFKCAIGTVFISVLIGTLAGAFALQYGAGDYTAITVSSIASLLSRDILLAVLYNRRYLGSLIRRALENLVDKFTR